MAVVARPGVRGAGEGGMVFTPSPPPHPDVTTPGGPSGGRVQSG